MEIILITGSAGLIGSEAARFFAEKGLQVTGLDNDMRRVFFGDQASTSWKRKQLEAAYSGYRHLDIDIRDFSALSRVFEEYRADIKAVIHTAAQPSHDWAAGDPLTDFSVNANGTLNLLELTRRFCPDAAFIFTSTNKVYGDRPNTLPLIELEQRWELPEDHAFYQGIDETMSIDGCLHSLFGASKAAADLLVQEYGRYFGMNTVCFRGGCLTGPAHSGAEQHGFLAYLMQCCLIGKEYRIYGYQGKQVRDNIHSHDLVQAFACFIRAPRPGAVYNIGGGRRSNCSVREAVELCERLTGKAMVTTYVDQARTGDHMWYISNNGKFQANYPDWQPACGLEETLEQIRDSLKDRLGS